MGTYNDVIDQITLVSLLNAISDYDVDVFQHSIRVACLAEKIAMEMHLGDKFCTEIFTAGLLHDYGKTMISRSILLKRGPLSDKEFRVIQKHPEFGRDVISRYCKNETVLSAIILHHERLDGGGYPNHLTGSEISESGRIMAVADVYDALINQRCYKLSKMPKEALSILKSDDNAFDSRVVNALVKVVV